MSAGLFGKYFVVPTASACVRAWKLAKDSIRDYQRLRRHGLKLAFWPGDINDDRLDTDLDWDWIETLHEKHIGELRIDEVIAGQNNIRIIFFKASKPIEGDPVLESGETMLRVWILAVFQKKSQGFSAGQLQAWRGMRDIIGHRFYGGDMTT